MSATEDIMQAVASHEGAMSTSEIVDACGQYAENTVRGELTPLVRQGRLHRPRQGWYEMPASGDSAEKKPVPAEAETGKTGQVRARLYGEASAENGNAVLAQQEDPGHIYVSPEKWESDHPGVPYGAAGHGYWIVRGDSAAPHYFAGEEVPVRRLGPTQRFDAEGIYIFHWNGHMYLKRLFQSEGGIYAQSLNPGVRDMQFRPGNGHDFAVHARVKTPMKQQLFISLLGSKLEPNR